MFCDIFLSLNAAQTLIYWGRFSHTYTFNQTHTYKNSHTKFFPVDSYAPITVLTLWVESKPTFPLS